MAAWSRSRAVLLGTLAFLILAGAGADRLLGEPSTTQPPGPEVVLYEEDFEDAVAQDWQFSDAQGRGTAAWPIVLDSGNHVLEARGHSWAQYSRDYWCDYTFKARVKLIKGAIQLNYRKSGCTRYFIRLSEEGLSLSKSSSCQNQPELRSRQDRYSRGRWYEVTITGAGGKLSIYVDGVLRITHVDAQPLLCGEIAFESLDGSDIYVDDVTVLGRAPQTLGLQWVSTGGPRGGIGYDIRIDPLDHNVLWVTDAYAGAHESTDGGRTWTAANSGITARAGPSGDAIPIFSLAIDQRQPDTLWAGTQGMRGVFKSTDGGRTWTEMDNGIEEQNVMEVRSFSVDPTNSDVVYMGGNYTPDPSRLAVRGFIYKTTDGGKHWTKLLEPGALVRWILLDPADTKVIYASTGIFDRIAVKPEGILKSTDGGRTWSNINEGLTSLSVSGLAMDPRNPEVLFATTGKASCFLNEERELYGAVFKTSDGGRHWRKLYPRGEGSEVRYSAVALAPSDPDIVYVDAGPEFLRSSDSGESWERFDTSPGARSGASQSFENRGQPIALAVHPENPDLIYMNAYDGGVFRSDDGGRTWTDASTGYSGAQAWDVATLPANPNYLVVGSKNGVHVSCDGGLTWQGRNTAGWINNILAIAIDPAEPKRILVGNEISGWIRMTTDGGRTWQEALPDLGVDTPSQRISIYGIAFAPSQISTVYAATGIASMTIGVSRNINGRGVYKSTDGGENWSPANRGLEAAGLNTFAVAVHPVDPNLVYVGTLGNGVFKSADGGATWSKASSGMPTCDVRSLAIAPSNPSVIYAGTDNSALFKSIDGGKTWQRSSAGLNPEASIRSIVLDPTQPQVLYVADRRSGVFRSVDGGDSWVRITEGLTVRAVNRLAISADGKVLYAATEGGGVFRLGDVVGAKADLSPCDVGMGVSQPGCLADSAGETVLYQEDFEDGLAQGWNVVRPNWDVTQGPDGNWVFRGQGHNWAQYAVDGWDDFTFKLRVKLLRGTIHINYRLGAGNRYYVAFDEQGVFLTKESPGGNRVGVGASPVSHSRDRWYDIRITGKGGQLDVCVDGVLVFTYVDPQPLLHGTIGLETLDDSEAYVDDIVVVGQQTQAQSCPSGSPTSEEALYYEDFESGLAQGWSVVPGWSVVRDASGNSVFHGEGHAWAQYAIPSWGDYTFRLRVKPVRGRIHLNYRISDCGAGGCNRYYVAFDTEGVFLMKNTSTGVFTELASQPGSYSPDQWHEIRIMGKGSHLDVCVDGLRVLSFVDPQPILRGTIGVETLDDSDAYVDDIAVLEEGQQ